MSLKREIEIFDNVRVSPETGETDVWDRIIFPNAIRKREIDLILNLAGSVRPRKILDFGCGTGWVSKALLANGYHVTGIDTSNSLIKSAAQSSSGKSQFLTGDCMNLPFCDETFDLVIGIAILHHLDPERGLSECCRVMAPNGAILLMEPNKYNPIAAAARVVIPVDTQTPDEEPFTPRSISQAFDSGQWNSKNIGYLFPYSFGLSQIFKKLKMDQQAFNLLCPFIKITERIFEKIPLFNRLCWVIVVEARKA